MPDFHVHCNIFKLPNVGKKLSKYWNDVIDLDNSLLWDFFCLEFSTTSNSHAERENLPRLVALRNLFTTFYNIIIFRTFCSSVISGPLAQSAERGADNAKVVSSSLTRTNQWVPSFYQNYFFHAILTAQINLFFFFSDFKVMVGTYLHQSHLFHIPHPRDTEMVSQGRLN